MADEDIVGIIEVPLNAYTYQDGKGRDEDPEIVKHLSDIFKKEGCKPDLWEHHIKGEIDAATYSRLLIALGLSEDKFRSTVKTGKYPQVRLRKRIVCLDGRHRIAAARGQFGKRFWWPVKLYRDPRVSRFSHQTKYPDGEICWHLFRLALGKQDLGGDWRSELSKSKKKILNLLLRREDGVFKHKDIVAALCAVLEFPGTRRGFKLGTMHKYTPLRCPEKAVRYLRRISRIYWEIAADASVVLHMDSKTIGYLQRRNPSNSVDRDYIRLMMDTGEIFKGVKSVSIRRRIKQKLLSLNVIIPSLETFHQNMIYFSLGAKILRNHIIDNPDKSQDRDQKDGDEGLFQSLYTCWTPPERPLMEVSEGTVQPLMSLDANLACLLLFLDGQRDCIYLSNEPILQDKRGEPAPVAAVDPWYVFRLQARARQYGFRTAKISRGLAAKPLSPRPRDWNIDWDARAKDWRGGKPTIRNFLKLQRDAFLPTLDQADSQTKVTVAFVQKDFLEAFFGPWSYVTDGPEMASDLPAVPGEDIMQIDEEDLRRPPEDAMEVDATIRPQPHGGTSQRAPPATPGLQLHQTQEPRQEPLPMQEPHPQLPQINDLVNPPETQAKVPDPALQVDRRELVLAETFEYPISRGDSTRSSRYMPSRQRDSKPRSKSRSSRSPISRTRRERSKVGPRSPIRPPKRATPPSGVNTALEELVTQPLIPLHYPTHASYLRDIKTQSLLAYDESVAQPQERLLDHTTRQQTTENQLRDKGTNRSLVRHKNAKSARFDPLRRSDRAKARLSKRSPIRPPHPPVPSPLRAGPSKRSPILPPESTIPPSFSGPELAEPTRADLPEARVHQINLLSDTSRNDVPQDDTRTYRSDPSRRPDPGEAEPSKRSPIRPPDHTPVLMAQRAGLAEGPRAEAAEPPAQIPYLDEGPSRNVIRHKDTDYSRFDPLSGPDRAKAETSTRSPIRPPDPISPPSPPRAEPTETPQVEPAERSKVDQAEAINAELVEAPAEQTILPGQDESTGRSIVRPQKNKKSARLDHLSRPDRAKARPSKRSPMRRPQSIVPASGAPAEEEPSTGSRIYMPNQPQAPQAHEVPEELSTFTDKRQASQLQGLVLDQTTDTQQTDGLHGRPRIKVRTRLHSSRSPDSRSRRDRPPGDPSRSPISRPQPTSRPRSPPRAKRAREADIAASSSDLVATRQRAVNNSAVAGDPESRTERVSKRRKTRSESEPKADDSTSKVKGKSTAEPQSEADNSTRGRKGKGKATVEDMATWGEGTNSTDVKEDEDDVAFQLAAAESRRTARKRKAGSTSAGPSREANDDSPDTTHLKPNMKGAQLNWEDVVTPHEEPPRRSPIHPPNQPQAPQIRQIPIPGASTNEYPASQGHTTGAQQGEHLPQNESNGHRKPQVQRDIRSPDGSRARSRSRSPSSRSPESRNSHNWATGGVSRSPITRPRLAPRARSPHGVETARGLRRSWISPPQIQTPRRSERLRLLSEEPKTPRRSERLRLLSAEPETPRRSQRLHLISKEPSLPTSTSRRSEKLTKTKKAVQTNPLKTLKKQERNMLRAPVGRNKRQKTRPKLPKPKAVPTSTFKVKKAKLESPKSKAVPTLRTTDPGAESPIHRNEEHQNALGIFETSNRHPVIEKPPNGPEKEEHSHAPPRVEGSVTVGRKSKGKAAQNAAETNANQPERPKKALTRRSPIRPPGTGFRVPNVQTPGTSSGSRIPGMSPSEDTLRGPRRPPIRPPGPPFPPASGSGQENKGQAQFPKLPQKVSAEGPRATETFSETRLAYPQEDLCHEGEDEEEEEEL